MLKETWQSYIYLYGSFIESQIIIIFFTTICIHWWWLLLKKQKNTHLNDSIRILHVFFPSTIQFFEKWNNVTKYWFYQRWKTKKQFKSITEANLKHVLGFKFFDSWLMVIGSDPVWSGAASKSAKNAFSHKFCLTNSFMRYIVVLHT